MKAKIKELETLFEKASKLAEEIAAEASDKATVAKRTYRSLRHSGRDEEEDAAMMDYDRYCMMKTQAEILEGNLRSFSITMDGLMNKCK